MALPAMAQTIWPTDKPISYVVPFAAGEYFEIANGSDLRRFVLDDVRMMMKWVLAIRLIRDEYYEKKTVS